MARNATMASGRERLLDATVALFLEAGIQATQTRAVTERAGVGTGLLNHYFRWHELRATAWSAIFEGLASDTRREGEAVEVALDRFFAQTFSAKARPIWRLWIEAETLAASDALMADALARARSLLRVALVDLLAAGCASGAWRLSAPAETALRLEALRDGLAGMILSGDPEVDSAVADRQLRAFFDLECRCG